MCILVYPKNCFIGDLNMMSIYEHFIHSYSVDKLYAWLLFPMHFSQTNGDIYLLKLHLNATDLWDFTSNSLNFHFWYFYLLFVVSKVIYKLYLQSSWVCIDIGQLINWKTLNMDRAEFKTKKESKVTKKILLSEMCFGKVWTHDYIFGFRKDWAR